MAQEKVTSLPDELTDEQMQKLAPSQSSLPDELTDEQINNLPQVKTPGILSSFMQKNAMAQADIAKHYPEMLTGAAKGLGHTLWELYDIGTRPFAHWASPEGPEALKPKTETERRAFNVEQVGEYFVPSGTAEKAITKIPAVTRAAVKGAPLAARFGRQLIRAGAQAIGAGTLAGIQTGSPEEALKTAEAAGEGTLAFGGLGFLVKKLGLEIGLKTIRPSIPVTRISPYDPKEASKQIIANMYKHNLGGTLHQTATKTETALLQLTAELEDILRDRPLARINLLDHISAVEAELQTRVKALPLTTVQGRRAALDWLFDATTQQYPNGIATLAEAQNYKRNISRLGAWFYGQRDPRAGAMEEVANSLYTRLKTTIENQSGLPERVQQINRNISELIPIERAVIERIPVAARNSLFNVSDLVAVIPGTTVGNWWPFVINRVLKTPWFANVAVKGGELVGSRAAQLGTLGGATVTRGNASLPPPPLPAAPNRAAAPPKTSDGYVAYVNYLLGR